MLEHGCIVCFSFRPRNRLYLFNKKKITAQQKNILKNWKNGKNDRFPYLCTEKMTIYHYDELLLSGKSLHF